MDYIQKKKEEFYNNEDLCVDSYDGREHYKSLRTNRDITDDVWKFIENTLTIQREELIKEIEGKLPTHSITWSKNNISQHLLARNEVKKILDNL